MIARNTIDLTFNFLYRTADHRSQRWFRLLKRRPLSDSADHRSQRWFRLLKRRKRNHFEITIAMEVFFAGELNLVFFFSQMTEFFHRTMKISHKVSWIWNIARNVLRKTEILTPLLIFFIIATKPLDVRSWNLFYQKAEKISIRNIHITLNKKHKI